MGRIADLAEKAWSNPDTGGGWQALVPNVELEEFGSGLAFLSSFANVTALSTSDGLALLDTGSFWLAESNFELIRRWSSQRLCTAIYTHGHVDHAFGLPPFEREARAQGWNLAEVVAHEAVAARFDRYQLTAGYNEAINARQFGMAKWPTEYRYPDRTYRQNLVLEIGGERIELNHDRGETDDHTWCFVPGRKLLCTGDLFIWASPNCGNPQKVQRYPRDWARALRRMADLDAELLFPGHGPPIFGLGRVRQALSETAELLETLIEQTLALMNSGARLNDVLFSVKAPEHLLERPYLRPVYDEPEFIVRNLWRLYGGWHDGNPANLKPARELELAAEIAALSGGPSRLAERAEELAQGGQFRLACHLAEFAALAAPADAAILAIRSAVYQARAERETSVMAKGVFNGAARGR